MNRIKLPVLIMIASCLLLQQAVVGQVATVGPALQDATSIVEQYTPLKGQPGPHPDFILPSIDGDEMIQLSAYRGKKVLLLHFASW